MNEAVRVGYLHGDYGDRVSHSFMFSFNNMFAWSQQHHLNYLRSDAIAIHAGTLDVVNARNRMVEYFLRMTDDTHLLMIDSDMGFPPYVADSLLTASTSTQGAVGALCYAQRVTGPDGLGGYLTEPQPLLFDFAIDEETGHGVYIDYEDQHKIQSGYLLKVAATGTGCLMVPRTALELMEKEYGTWFDQVRYQTKVPVSEDLSFCYRLNCMGIPIYVDTGTKTSHHKAVWI